MDDSNTSSAGESRDHVGQTTECHAFLIRYLAEHEARCPICRYNLKNLTSPTCPECGADLELRVGAADSTNTSWIILLLAMAIPAGIGVLTWCGCVMSEGEIFELAEYGTAGVTMLILMGYTILCQLGVLCALATRMTFLRLPKPTQTVIANLAAVMTGVAFLIFFVTVASEMY